MNTRLFLAVRVLTFLIGFLTVAWQILQAATGNWANAFFFPDLIVGVPLTIASFFAASFKVELSWLIGLSSMSGIYLVSAVGAATEGMFTDSWGPTSTAIGLFVCFPFMYILSKRLVLRAGSLEEHDTSVTKDATAVAMEEGSN